MKHFHEITIAAARIGGIIMPNFFTLASARVGLSTQRRDYLITCLPACKCWIAKLVCARCFTRGAPDGGLLVLLRFVPRELRAPAAGGERKRD